MNMEERDERKERTWARRPYTTGTKKRDTMNEMTTCSREGDRKGGEDNRKKWRAEERVDEKAGGWWDGHTRRKMDELLNVEQQE